MKFEKKGGKNNNRNLKRKRKSSQDGGVVAEDPRLLEMGALENEKFSVFNRKKQRKEKKLQQKQKNHDFWMKGHSKKYVESQKKEVQALDQGVEKQPEKKQKQEEQQRQKQEKEKKKKREEKKEKEISGFSKLEQIQKELEQDEQEIHYYERLLGKSRGKKTLQKRFQNEIKNDGLEDMFALLDKVDESVKLKDLTLYTPFIGELENEQKEEPNEEEENELDDEEEIDDDEEEIDEEESQIDDEEIDEEEIDSQEIEDSQEMDENEDSQEMDENEDSQEMDENEDSQEMDEKEDQQGIDDSQGEFQSESEILSDESEIVGVESFDEEYERQDSGSEGDSEILRRYNERKGKNKIVQSGNEQKQIKSEQKQQKVGKGDQVEKKKKVQDKQKDLVLEQKKVQEIQKDLVQNQKKGQVQEKVSKVSQVVQKNLQDVQKKSEISQQEQEDKRKRQEELLGTRREFQDLQQQEEKKNFSEQDGQEEQEIRKQLNRVFNRVSETNLELIFGDVVKCFDGFARNKVGRIFGETLVRFSIEPFKLGQNQQSVNCVLVSGVHHLYDNFVFSMILNKLIEYYQQNFILRDLAKEESFQDGQEKVNIAGLRRQNWLRVVCHFYLYDNVSIDFVKELIEDLMERKEILGDECLDLLNIGISLCAQKIRSDSPQTLKDLIQRCKIFIEKSYSGNKIGEFIILSLNEVKMNKNIKAGGVLERIEFLQSWLKRTVQQKYKTGFKNFVLSFKETIQADRKANKWWEPTLLKEPIKGRKESGEEGEEETNQENKKLVEQLNLAKEKRIQLEKLAAKYKMTTEVRKQIFVLLMSSEDYLDASQKLLKLKLNKNQSKEIPLVLVECCLVEKTYNPFYELVARQISQVFKKFSYHLALTILDRFSNLQEFSIRKISNLSKITSSFAILGPLTISILKNFEFNATLHETTQIFLQLFLDEYFNKIENQKFIQQVEKTKNNSNNFIFLESFYNFLKNTYKPHAQKIDNEKKKQNILQKIKYSLQQFSPENLLSGDPDMLE